MRENIIIFNNMIRGLFSDCIQNMPEKGRELESSIEVTYKFSKQILLKDFVDKINKEGKLNIKIATKGCITYWDILSQQKKKCTLFILLQHNAE